MLRLHIIIIITRIFKRPFPAYNNNLGIVVSSGGGGAKVFWDSGLVNASAAVGVRCGVALPTLTTYTWSASWVAARLRPRHCHLPNMPA